jgi:hypothetical protein
MFNVMQQLNQDRSQDVRNSLLQQQMQRESQMHPLQMEAAQMNMLAKRQAMQQDEMRRNALQQYGATGNINALAMGDPETAAKIQMQREGMNQRNQLMRDQMAMRERVMGARGGGRPQIVQTANGPMILNPDGTARPVTTADGVAVKAPEHAEKPMTEFQGKASLFGTRMQNSHDILTPLEAKTSQTGLAVKRSLQDTPVIGGILGAAANLALSNEQQSIEQAQRDFINATLRQESGAVISQPEFENAQRQYFPQPGDNPALLDQKRKNREIAIAGFERMAGKEGGAAIRDVRNMRKGGIPGASGGWQIQEVK